MGKRTKERKEKGRPITVPRAKPNLPLLVLSLIGVLLTSYLAYTAFTGSNVKGCAVGGGCDVVLGSKWAVLMGLPTSFWGLMTYLALAGTAVMGNLHRRWKLASLFTTMGLVYSVYLTTVSLTMLKAACPYCLTSLTLMTVVFALTAFQRPTDILNFRWPRWLAMTVAPAAAFVLIAHLNYVGILGQPPAPEDPYARALAVYLSQQGVKMYGASWCPHCQEQKEMFGRAAVRLPYIECSPNGQGNPQAAECQAQKIETYPTWFIAGQRVEDVMSLDRLAFMTGFKYQPTQ